VATPATGSAVISKSVAASAEIECSFLPTDLAAGQSRLLRAALAVFSRRGFHGATTREIAELAGFSPGALYTWFGSKTELLFELARFGTEDALRHVSSVEIGGANPLDVLRLRTRAHVVWHARNHTVARVTNYELRALDPEHRKQIVVLRKKYERMIRDAVVTAIDAKQATTTDAEVVALAILSLGIDVARWFSPDGRLSADELGEYYSEMVIRMVKT
jgi:AcrR family transcriptional regulator